MQIVIDISKHIYDCVIGKTVLLSHMEGICKAIEEGTPLPEHHGRIIDESKITKCYMPINQLDVRGIRTDAPTIIEGSDTE